MCVGGGLKRDDVKSWETGIVNNNVVGFIGHCRRQIISLSYCVKLLD